MAAPPAFFDNCAHAVYARAIRSDEHAQHRSRSLMGVPASSHERRHGYLDGSDATGSTAMGQAVDRSPGAQGGEQHGEHDSCHRLE